MSRIFEAFRTQMIHTPPAEGTPTPPAASPEQPRDGLDLPAQFGVKDLFWRALDAGRAPVPVQPPPEPGSRAPVPVGQDGPHPGKDIPPPRGHTEPPPVAGRAPVTVDPNEPPVGSRAPRPAR